MPGGMGGGMPSVMPSGGMPSGGGGGMPGGGGGGMSGGGGGGGGAQLMGGVTLTEEDVEDISAVVPGIESISILTSGSVSVDGGSLDEETTLTAAGVSPEYAEISNLSILYGEFFDEYADEDKDKVCVMGYKAAQTVFGAAYLATGDFVSIEGKNYEVLGVLSEMGTVSSGISPDESIYIPYSTAAKYVFGSSAEPKISAVAADVTQVADIMADIETVLTQNYPDAEFTITDAGSEMEAATQSANTLQTLLIAVASIVFIVGGIGIMNVLIVTVKERTGEIGLLKALGSKKGEILTEFLLEAGMIAFFGGVLGTALGYVLIPAVEMTGTRADPSTLAGILALVFAVVTGTLFGFYPALQASKLTPIEALSD